MWQQIEPFLRGLLSQPWGVAIMGLAVAGLCFLIGRSFLRSRGPNHAGSIGNEVLPQSVSNRRTCGRRRGNVIAVVIKDPENKQPEQSGWVLDRSGGGLRLEVDHEIVVGKLLCVRPRDTSESTPWSEVVVRSCRSESGCYQLGLQFVKTPGYSVLMLFG
jgi:hypothetical protein